MSSQTAFCCIHGWYIKDTSMDLDCCCGVFFSIADVCLLADSVRNTYRTKYRVYFGRHAPSCKSLRKGVFGAGVAFIVLIGIVNELYYVSYLRARDFQAPSDSDSKTWLRGVVNVV